MTILLVSLASFSAGSVLSRLSLSVSQTLSEHTACTGCTGSAYKSQFGRASALVVLANSILGRSCIACHRRLSPYYPLTECLSVLIATVLLYRFGFGWQLMFGVLFSFSLLLLAAIDMQTGFLPDGITLPILWLGLLVNTANLYIAPAEAIVGAALGYSALWLIATTFQLLTQQEGMGYGDFKLFAMIGAWLGWMNLPWALLLASVLALSTTLFLCWSRKSKEALTTPMPFGPYLAFAGWIVFICH
jgi:leader peptidase (prepilin peptidase)/N-methyltransferase